MAQMKNGYLKIVNLMLKVLPDLSKGIQLIGFIRDYQRGNTKMEFEGNEECYYMIYNKDTGLLYGVTQNCQRDFGIYCQLVYGNPKNTSEFTIDLVCPDLLDPDKQERLESDIGLECQFDSTSIQQNYLLG